MAKQESFDLTLAKECASAYTGATGLGCIISDSNGDLLSEYGYGCRSCMICERAGKLKTQCVQAQNYGMTEAERFGGKYIYYCPMGLTCFVSPILGELHSAAKITVGPFLMVEHQDFIDCELDQYDNDKQELIVEELVNVPVITPAKVNDLSTLLFMAVGFMNKVSVSNRLLDSQTSDALQGQITTYIMQLKNEETPPPYPFAIERSLLKSISDANKTEAQRLLNEMMGHILFSTGRDFELVKSRILELMTLISRAAIEAGANAEYSLNICHESRSHLSSLHNIEELCLWLSDTATHFMDSIFKYADARHANAIHRCVQYIEANYHDKVSLDLLAGMVYLSPPYLSRVFKQETGTPFNTYLNEVRVQKAKELLRHEEMRLIDIAEAVGFEDQSYFTKVFKRIVGLTPLHYRAQIKNTRDIPARAPAP